MGFLPHKLILNSFVQYVLREDLTYNDITTELIVEEGKIAEAVINFRQAGIVCGMPFVSEVYNILNPSVKIDILKDEGEEVIANTNIAVIKGHAKSILTGERTALNILQKASGIATTTNAFIKKLEGTKARLTDTRKTTPGCRILEKYAIKLGGALPHRYNLSDCILIKDNHIAMAGSITEAVRRAKQHCSHTMKIEVETENDQQVKEALDAGADIIMLDNMSIEMTKAMVKLIGNKAIIESSGNVNLDTIEAIAKTGVDCISTSAITTKAPVLDIGLDFV